MIILQSNGRQVEKEGRTEIQKSEYIENEKSFSDEIKSIYHSFWRAIIWWKNKKMMKIADTSFKDEKFFGIFHRIAIIKWHVYMSMSRLLLCDWCDKKFSVRKTFFFYSTAFTKKKKHIFLVIKIPTKKKQERNLLHVKTQQKWRNDYPWLDFSNNRMKCLLWWEWEKKIEQSKNFND